MKKTYLFIFVLAAQANALAQIREFQTTRLHSTAGAGVASILSTEAAILNPASSAFFDGSSMSYQSYQTHLQDENDLRNLQNDPFAKRNEHQGLFLSDNNGPVKGGVAYITQAENNFRRERLVLNSAAPMGPRSSMGLTYNYLQDKRPRAYGQRHQVHHQLAIGMSHLADEDTALGLVVTDPTRTTPGEERAIAGFQYNIASRFILIGDVGAQYTKDVLENYLWRGAIQLNIFSDFFFRAGRSYDNITKFKSTGWGVGWVGPRLGLEFAQRFSDYFGSGPYLYEGERLVDTSFSAFIKF